MRRGSVGGEPVLIPLHVRRRQIEIARQTITKQSILRTGVRWATFGSMFLTLAPAPHLAPFVTAYWFIEDIPGEYEGRAIRTSPVPAGVLSVNLGRPNAGEDGSLVPHASLLGLQSRARCWRSWSDTYFVMAMLSVPGMVRLFPHTGSVCANRLVDLGAILGDAGAGELSTDVTAAFEPGRIASRLDRWLTARLTSCDPVPESARILAAHAVLRAGGPVAKAADAARTDRRQLHRWFHRHLGVGPKDLADLERLQQSLRAVQTGHGDPVAGFSDQAHQIRNWRRRLGVTPGTYGKSAASGLATHFATNPASAAPAFYL